MKIERKGDQRRAVEGLLLPSIRNEGREETEEEQEEEEERDMHSSVSLHPMFLFGPGSISTDHLWQIRRRRRPVTKNASRTQQKRVEIP